MVTRGEKFRAGLFVLGGWALFLAGLVALGYWKLSKTERLYYGYFREPVTGLEVKAPVRYSGVTVGQIRAVRLDSEDPSRTKVTLDIQPEVPITRETTAALRLVSPLTGLLSVELSGGTKGSERLPEGSKIPTKISWMGKLQADAPSLVEESMGLLHDLRKMLREENRQKLDEMVSALHTILTADPRGMAETLRRLDADSQRLSSILGKTDQVLGEVQGMVSENREDLHASLGEVRSLVTELNGWVKGTKESPLFGEVRQAFSNVNSLLERLDVALGENQGDIREAVENFRAASRDLRELVQSLRQQPTSLMGLTHDPEREIPE